MAAPIDQLLSVSASGVESRRTSVDPSFLYRPIIDVHEECMLEIVTGAVDFTLELSSSNLHTDWRMGEPNCARYRAVWLNPLGIGLGELRVAE